MNWHRRTLLCSLLGAATSVAMPERALARRRAHYGGTCDLFLPVDTTRIDPHDPHDLASALLSGALFETLYAKSLAGSAYSTLAAQLPRSENGKTVVELRPALSFASGRPLDAKQVVASLQRSMASSPALKDLGVVAIVRGAPRNLSFSQKDIKKVLSLLTHPRAAIVPGDFSASAPDTSGAFLAAKLGDTLRLQRNPLAPRGGSYLDEVVIHSAALSDGLRAFEARRSDLGFLGAGLHRERPGASRFGLNPIGLALLVPGTRRRSQMSVGSLHEALARLPDAPLSAIGVKRTRHAPERWNGGPAELAVPQGEPWLVALAEEMRSAWSARGHAMSVRTLARSQIATLRKSGNFDLMLEFLGSRGIAEAETTAHLFELDGRPPPRGGRTLPPLESGRQLSLGIVGALTPSGALSPRVRQLVSGDRLTLENTEALD